MQLSAKLGFFKEGLDFIGLTAVTSNARVFKSFDQGEGWTEITTPAFGQPLSQIVPNPTVVAINPYNNMIYCAGGALTGSNTITVAQSSDGVNWSSAGTLGNDSSPGDWNTGVPRDLLFFEKTIVVVIRNNSVNRDYVWFNFNNTGFLTNSDSVNRYMPNSGNGACVARTTGYRGASYPDSGIVLSPPSGSTYGYGLWLGQYFTVPVPYARLVVIYNGSYGGGTSQRTATRMGVGYWPPNDYMIYATTNGELRTSTYGSGGTNFNFSASTLYGTDTNVYSFLTDYSFVPISSTNVNIANTAIVSSSTNNTANYLYSTNPRSSWTSQTLGVASNGSAWRALTARDKIFMWRKCTGSATSSQAYVSTTDARASSFAARFMPGSYTWVGLVWLP